ncbi:MAG: sulfatase-like hydrolase/transferase [Gammaproteobacteria bacterium]|nr:sulfatase-like hydrolase/transferase [Gammaproteobacteria bacterium]
MSSSTPSKASPLLYHWSKDLQVWAFIALSLSLFRAILITTFHQQSDAITLANLLSVLGTGFRYDIAVAAVWVLPTVLLSVLLPPVRLGPLLQKIRQWLFQFYIILGVPLLGAALGFFGEFGDQFNMRIFGIIHDDTEAILITVWKEYHPIPFLALSLLLIWGASRLGARWFRYEINWRKLFMRPLSEKKLVRLVIYFGCFIFFLAMTRGGLLWKEPMRLKHAFVTDDLFLNRTVVNPISALRFTIQEKLIIDGTGGFKRLWSNGDIQSAANHIYGQNHSLTSGVSHQPSNIDQLLQRSTSGPLATAPQHLFFLLLESQSGWTIMPQYRALKFSPQLSKIAEEGIYFPNFLASSSGTIPTVSALFTGMPNIGLNINYELESTKAYPSGIATLMRSLGYKTRLFYGGYLSWERLDQFAPNQGFDELHGGGKMSRDGTETNEWGVDDKRLFDYVLKNIDPDIPSFNFILTTTNHPPFDIDLDAAGFPMTKLPSQIVATKGGTLRRLGHIWYADKQAGGFVRRANERFSDSLFAITADHTARAQLRFPGNNLLEPVAVPFILYGPDVLGEISEERQVLKHGGSHIDIPPTLVNMVAPKGTLFTSFGKDLLNKGEHDYALGASHLIGDSFIKGNNQRSKVAIIDKAAEPPTEHSIATAEKSFSALKALSWWRVKKGAQLPQRPVGTPPQN